MKNGQLEFEFTGQRWKSAKAKAAKEYGLAAALVLSTFLLLLPIVTYWREELPYLAFIPGIIVATWLLRTGPAIFAVILSFVLGEIFFVPPKFSLLPATQWAWFEAALYLLACFALVHFAHRGRRALERERRSAQALQRQAQELAASEELNRKIVSSMTDLVKVLSIDGKLLSFSASGRRLMHIEDPNTVLNRSWPELWPEDQREIVRSALARATTGQAARFTGFCPTLKGHARWWDVIVTPICDQNGNPERLLSISRDITERHLAEISHRESEERRRLALQATGDAVWDLDLVNDRLTVNETFERTYGHPGEEHWRQWWLSRIHPEDVETFNKALCNTLNSDKSHFVSEYRLLQTSGEWGRVLDRAFIARDDHRRPKRVVGAMMDLVPVKQAQERSQLLAETAGLLLRTDSPQQVVEELCQRVLTFLRCDVFFNFLVDDSRQGLLLNACGGISPEERHQCMTLEIGKAVCGCVAIRGKGMVVEDVQASADPAVAIVKSLGVQAYACHPLETQGKILGTLSFGTRTRPKFKEDELALMKAVTDLVAIAMERQQWAATLVRMNEELERRVQERTEVLARTTDQLNSFCYSVAHDLRAPLRTQNGFARLLLDDYGQSLDDTGRHYLKAIMQSAERQSNIIQDLMAHVNVSRADLALEDVPLRGALDQVLADLEADLIQKEASVDHSRLVNFSVVANRSSLHLVLLNLISNACKFVPKGRRPRIHVRSERLNGVVRLWVEDNGIGIAQADRGRLFGMFQRLQKGDFPGTGMGLAIVKTAIERMGGTVGLESEPEVGSRFWVNLPFAAQPEQTHRRSESAEAAIIR